VQTASKTSKN
jgi:hypothetical protein